MALVASGVVVGVVLTLAMTLAAWHPWSRGRVPSEAAAHAVETAVSQDVATSSDSSLMTVRDLVGQDVPPSSGVARAVSYGNLVGWDLNPFGTYELSLPEGFALWGVWYDDGAKRLCYGVREGADGVLEDRCVMSFYDEGAIGSYGIERSQVLRSWRMPSGRAAAIVDGFGGTRVVVFEDGDTDMAIPYAVPFDAESDADGSWGEVVCDVCGCEAESAADALDDVMAGVVERTWGD